MLKFILVSQSPQRRKLLQQEGFIFENSSVSVSEKLSKNINLDEGLQDIARRKAECFVRSQTKEAKKAFLVLCADTLVCVKNQTLGKPKDEQQAYSHLQTLSGTRHAVKTALCFYDGLKDRFITGIDTTFIEFKTLTPKEIEDFLKTKDYENKAGGYGIQGPAQHFIVKKEGSFSNVLGLPLELLYKMIKDNEWVIERKFRKSEL